MKFQDLKVSLQNGVLPVYLIQGKDAFLRNKAEEMIVNTAVPTLKDINVIIFNDENANIENIMTSGLSLPMMTDKKCIVLRDVILKAEKDIAVLLGLCKNPTPSTCLIIVDSNNNACYKEIAKYAMIVDCATLDAPMVQKIVINILSKFKVSIDITALNTLLAYCNLDLMRITNEAVKLASYVGENGIIKVDDVELLVHKDVEFSIFELGNAVSKGDGKKAINIITLLLEKKEQPQTLMMMIQSNFRRMFYTVSTKLNNKDIADLLGVKEYSIKVARETARNFTPVKLKSILDLGEELDYKIKAGLMSAENALYFFVTNLTIK